MLVAKEESKGRFPQPKLPSSSYRESPPRSGWVQLQISPTGGAVRLSRESSPFRDTEVATPESPVANDSVLVAGWAALVKDKSKERVEKD